MKRSVCLVTMVVVVAACASAVCAGQGERKKGKRESSRPPRVLRGTDEAIAKELKLDEATVQKMAEAIKAKNAALKAWREDPAKGGRMKELGQKLRSPEVKGDKAKIKEIRQQMAPLAAEQQALLAKLDAAVTAVLTPEQQAKWKATAFYLSVAGPLKKAELTEQQTAKIKALCEPAQKKIAALDSKDRKGRNAAMKELRTAVMAVLTPEQQAKLKAKPAQSDKPASREKAQKKKPEQRKAKGGRKKKKSDSSEDF